MYEIDKASHYHQTDQHNNLDSFKTVSFEKFVRFFSLKYNDSQMRTQRVASYFFMNELSKWPKVCLTFQKWLISTHRVEPCAFKSLKSWLTLLLSFRMVGPRIFVRRKHPVPKTKRGRAYEVAIISYFPKRNYSLKELDLYPAQFGYYVE